ncbi:MAG: hypothetical protein JO306_04020 [Gemmatimonadetes bacterium]|nr:hypothetical protein [Gemmatimonadota bacterium]
MPADTLARQVVDTWRIHHRINLYLLDAIPPEALADVGPTKGRSVRKTFAHLHLVRLMWLKAAGPELLEGMEKLEDEHCCPADVSR